MSQNSNAGTQACLPAHLVEDLVALMSSSGQASGHASGTAEIVLRQESDKTPGVAIQVLIDGFNELLAAGYALSSPWSIRETHMHYLMHRWVDKSGQQPSVVLSKLNCWRDLVSNMRKAALLATIEDWIKEPADHARRHARQNGTVRIDLGLDVRDLIAPLTRVAEQDRWVGIQIELQSAFNLEATSSMLFRPLEFVRLSGQLHVPDKTQKNGRARVITLDQRWQYDLLLRAVRLSSPTTGVMFPATWTLKTWHRHYCDVLRSLGLSRTIWGASMESLPGCASSAAYADRMADPSRSPEHTDDLFVDHVEITLDRHARRAAMLRFVERVTSSLPLSQLICVEPCVEKGSHDRTLVSAKGHCM